MPDAFYRSAEIRWFLPAQNRLDQLLHWFRLRDQFSLLEEGHYDLAEVTGPFVKLERERTDRYLLLPDCTTVGVKQRQGMLEVKTLLDGPVPFSLGSVAGFADQWVKWSFKPSDAIARPLETELDLSGPWRSVVKKRYLQQVSLDSGGPVAVSPDRHPDAGWSIELTAVDLEATVGSWLTFGFEAFGPSARLMALLEEAVQHFFATHGPAPVRLDERESLSYPAWLAQIR